MSDEARLYPSALVRHVDVGGTRCCWTFRNGEYVVMNEAASAMWRALVGGATAAQRLDALLELKAPRSRIQADTDVFMHDCLRRGYLQTRPPEAPTDGRSEARSGAPNLASAWISLIAAGASLKRADFQRAYEAALATTKPRPTSAPDDERLARAQRTFVAAENLVPRAKAPIDCLPRSLALYRFLSRAGIVADHVIGVRRYPFRAHAWVESGGQVLLNDPEEVAAYTVIARL